MDMKIVLQTTADYLVNRRLQSRTIPRISPVSTIQLSMTSQNKLKIVKLNIYPTWKASRGVPLIDEKNS